jgi:hypothetical protein
VVRLVFPLALVLVSAFLDPAAQAQLPCPHLPGSTFPLVVDNRVACTVPQLYGPQGLAVEDFVGPLQNSAGTGGSFVGTNGKNFLLSVSESVATQIASLPLVAPAAGISLIFDKSLGTFTASNDSFGPIFSERASTIGRNRFAIGFSYQYMNFDSIDGVNLHSFPTLFVQTASPFSGQPCDPLTQGNSPPGQGGGVFCGIAHDYVTASNRIDLKINQYTSFATFGVTRRIDVSVAVPVQSVYMNAAADTSIVYNSESPNFLAFGFQTTSGFPKSNGVCLSSISNSFGGTQCVRANFFNSQRASGIGDITVRVKASVREWERSGLSLGVDVRVPTGDEKNFLGTGAIGIKPFAVWSRSGRISPHVNVGYEWNGRSVLAGDITTGTKDNLPGEFLYSAGVEAGISKKLTASLDWVGQTIINGARVHLVQELAPGPCDTPALSGGGCQNPLPPVHATTVEGLKGTYAIDNASLGLRYRPFGKFLVSASVLLKLDNGGLRSAAIPLVSATYTFR